MMKIFMIGDIVGQSGRRALDQYLPQLKQKYGIDVVIGNGENAAHGKGMTRRVYDELVFNGLSLISMGNHTFSKRELFDFIDEADRLVVPLNQPATLPGVGSRVIEVKGIRIRLTNLLGITFMNGIVDNPFASMDQLLSRIDKNEIHIVDFHAEATSEKLALGHYLDGRVQAVLGTHTHIQTADERLLPKGTAYITDIGMTGPYDSIIGSDISSILHKMTTGLAGRYQIAEGPAQFCGVILDIDEVHYRVLNIERVYLRPEN